MKSSFILKWVQELGSTFSDSEWLKAIHYNSSHTKCINYWEISQKIIHRWYLTPVRLAKFTNADNLCWRGCQGVGSLLHTLWECPQLKSFLNQIFKLISEVTGCLTKPKAALALLSLGIGNFSIDYRTVLIHILFIARFLESGEVL